MSEILEHKVAVVTVLHENGETYIDQVSIAPEDEHLNKMTERLKDAIDNIDGKFHYDEADLVCNTTIEEDTDDTDDADKKDNPTEIGIHWDNKRDYNEWKRAKLRVNGELHTEVICCTAVTKGTGPLLALGRVRVTHIVK